MIILIILLTAYITIGLFILIADSLDWLGFWLVAYAFSYINK